MSTLEELLAKTNNYKKKKALPKMASQVVNFIKDKQITTGEVKIPGYFIYFKYVRKWKLCKKMNKVTFLREFSKYFSSYRDKIRGFLLNNSLDFNPDSNLEAKLYEIREKIKKRDKKLSEKKAQKEQLSE